jgi:hypothetical protein
MRRKTDKQKEADKKGKERMKRFEENQIEETVIDKSKIKDDEKLIVYYGNYFGSGWQKMEYLVKIVKK